jgi:dihydrofolate reductase
VFARCAEAVIAAGLVDEYRLFVYPVVLRRGVRLFADATELPRLRLVKAQPFRSGIFSCGTGSADAPGLLVRRQRIVSAG